MEPSDFHVPCNVPRVTGCKHMYILKYTYINVFEMDGVSLRTLDDIPMIS